MQTPAPFGYERATSVDHAIQLLEQLGPDSRLVAGGHSLLPMMKIRLAQPEHVIDINPLAGELGSISIDGDELVIGAMARHNDLLDSALVGEHFPILQDAERVIADPIVRNRGTVGGSLCQADPAEDLSAALSALHATAVIRGSGGSANGPGPRAPRRPLRDRRRRRRDPDGDPGADPQRMRKRLREGRTSRRRLGDRVGSGRRLARRRHHRRRRDRARRRRRRALRLTGRRGGTARPTCERGDDHGSGRSSRAPNASRRPTSAARPSTSVTWPAS